MPLRRSDLLGGTAPVGPPLEESRPTSSRRNSSQGGLTRVASRVVIRRPVSEPEASSIAQSAFMAGVSRTKLYEALADGSLPSLKIGRRRLVRRDALKAWLAGLEQQSNP